MNAIQYALNHVRQTIPQQILDLAFSQQSIVQYNPQWRFNSGPNQSTDAIIREKIIDGRVNIDCNLIGGTQIAINLEGKPYEQYDLMTKVFEIPYEYTGGRRIVSVQTLNYLTYHGLPTNMGENNNQLLNAAQDLYKSVAQMPIVSTANCQLIGDNVVMVRDDVQHLSDRLAMTCTVAHDEQMNNLNPGIYPLYARLVELATKAYIYVHTAIPMDQGRLYAGMELGRVREMIEDYADSNELYREVFNEQWKAASFMNDRPRAHKHIKSMFGRGM